MTTSMDDSQLPEMVVIAEVCCSPREVRKILERKAEALLKGMSRWKTPTRAWMIEKLNEFCDQHHYAQFQRKKTIEAIAKRSVERWKWANYRRLRADAVRTRACQAPRSASTPGSAVARPRSRLPRRKYRRPKQQP